MKVFIDMTPETEFAELIDGSGAVPECPDCDGREIRVESREQGFQYGRGAEAVEIKSVLPVYRCVNCGLAWTGAEAEEKRQEAVCHHFNRLTPRQVLSIREELAVSQAEFGRITGFGAASLSRWETGSQLQSASCDRLLRLLAADARNASRLRKLADVEARARPKFRVIEITAGIIDRQRLFQLRKPPRRRTG